MLETLVVNSIFATTSLVCFLAMKFPAIGPQIWLGHKVIMALSVCCFVDLTLDWYGGADAMVTTIGEKTEIDMSCKCFLVLRPWMKHQTLTKTWIKVNARNLAMLMLYLCCSVHAALLTLFH